MNMRQEIKERGHVIKLVVILVGTSKVSETYIRAKKRYCERVGIDCFVMRLSEEVKGEELTSIIVQLNEDDLVTGIVVQLSFPKRLNSRNILSSIDFKKDVDGLIPINRSLLSAGDETLACCTPKGIFRLLDEYNIDLFNKRVVVVGNGFLVGYPLSIMLKNRDIDFVVCDKQRTFVILLLRQIC